LALFEASLSDIIGVLNSQGLFNRSTMIHEGEAVPNSHHVLLLVQLACSAANLGDQFR
jgi:hypothetical protein